MSKKRSGNTLGCSVDDVLGCSGKTGEGVAELLAQIIENVAPPKNEFEDPAVFRSLVFRF